MKAYFHIEATIRTIDKYFRLKYRYLNFLVEAPSGKEAGRRIKNYVDNNREYQKSYGEVIEYGVVKEFSMHEVMMAYQMGDLIYSVPLPFIAWKNEEPDEL